MHQQVQEPTITSRAFAGLGPNLGRLARRGLIVLSILTLLGNLAFVLGADRLAADPPISTGSGQSTALILAEVANNARVLTADRDNMVTLLENQDPVANIQFDNVIGDIAITADGMQALVGTSNGVVTVLDDRLAPLLELTVEGRVVALKSTPDNGIVVGYGVGAFGDRYWVSYFPNPSEDAAFTTQVDFTISDVSVMDGMAVYSTQDSRVGAIALDSGERTWTTTLRSPVTSLQVITGRGEVLAGSENGDVSLLSARGDTLWTVNVSAYPLRGLAYDRASDRYLAGDSQGNLVVINGDGSVAFEETISTSDIQAIAPVQNGTMLLVPREGSWKTLMPAAIDTAGQMSQLRIVWLGFNLVLLTAATAAVVVAVERLRTQSWQWLRLVWRSRLAYIFLLPAILLIIFFAYYPSGLAFYYSLTNFSLRSITEFIGLENYRRVLFEDTYFRTGIINMGIIILSSILKTLTVPLLVAQLVFWLHSSNHQYIFRTLFILPAVVPDLVFTLMWQQVYNPNTGFLNQFLATMGLSQYQRAWLGDPQTALWAVIGVGFPFVSAFAFLIFLGGLLSINPDYFDAAKVDGAKWWQRFLHIDVPLLLPQVRILLFFAIVGTVQGFASIFILTRGGPGTSTYVPALQMYLRISDGDFAYASAIGIVLFIIVLVITFFILRFRRNDAIETA